MTKIRLLAAAFAVGAVAAGHGLMNPPSVLAQGVSEQDLPVAMERYGQAWASGDAVRIAALHTPGSVFHLMVEGGVPVTGRAAIETHFAQILADNPAYSSTPRTLRFGPDFVVIEYDFVMAPPTAFVMGQLRYEPSGRTYSVPAIDVITFRDGLVSSKVTYLDGSVIRSNSLRAMPADTMP